MASSKSRPRTGPVTVHLSALESRALTTALTMMLKKRETVLPHYSF